MSMLIIAPHPDDETLGMGGTILKSIETGEKVYWLIVTDVKEEYGYKSERIEKRKKEIEKVTQEYKFEKVFNLGLEPANLEKYQDGEIIDKFSSIIKQVKPATVVLPYNYDVHSDHRKVFNCAYSCTKVFRYPFIKKILCMEILSETNFCESDNIFKPNYYIDITNQIHKKKEIMKIYESEIKEHPFPRSLEGIDSLGKIRGIEAGCRYAEAFRIIKMIE